MRPETRGLVVLVALWYASNAAASVASKKAAAAFYAPSTRGMFLTVVLSCLQCAVGAAVCYALLPGARARAGASLNKPIAHRAAASSSPSGFNAIAALHLAGAVSTNAGMTHGSASLVLLIKATQPLTTLVASTLFLGRASVTRVTFASVALVVAGAIITSSTDHTLNAASVTAAFVSNVALSLRNVLSKRLQLSSADGPPLSLSRPLASNGSPSPRAAGAGTTPSFLRRTWAHVERRIHGGLAAGAGVGGGGSGVGARLSGVHLFAALSATCTVVMVPAALVAAVMDPQLLLVLWRAPAALGWTVVASACHPMYNCLSYMVLERVEPLTHEVLNSGKRVWSIAVAMLSFGASFGWQQLLGLPFILAGMLLRAVDKTHAHTHARAHARTSSHAHSAARAAPASSPAANALSHAAVFLVGAAFSYVYVAGVGAPHAVSGDGTAAGPAGANAANVATDEWLTCLGRVQDKTVDALWDVVGALTVAGDGGARFPGWALIDPAHHGNLGDNLIVNGELQMMTRMGWPPETAYQCAPGGPTGVLPQCDFEVLRRLPLVTWHGGGNFGDVWREMQDARLAGLTRLLDETDALLMSWPQSMHYSDEAMLASDAALLADAHARSVRRGAPVPAGLKSRLVLCWRQRDSLSKAQVWFPFADNRLMPDIAFMSGPLSRHGRAMGVRPPAAPLPAPAFDVLFLLRTDKESVAASHSSAGGMGSPAERGMAIQRLMDNATDALGMAPASVRTTDFLAWQATDFPMFRVTTDASRHQSWLPFFELFAANATGLAASRAQVMVAMMSSVHLVATDRLHCSVIAALTHTPHVMLDQMYGKLGRTRDVAFDGIPECNDAALQASMASTLEGLVMGAARRLQELRPRLCARDPAQCGDAKFAQRDARRARDVHALTTGNGKPGKGGQAGPWTLAEAAATVGVTDAEARRLLEQREQGLFEEVDAQAVW